MPERHPIDATPNVSEVFAVGLALQDQSLALLRAEVKALATLLPCHIAPHPTEAETEAEQDNMPV